MKTNEPTLRVAFPVVRILKDARARIADPAQWTTGGLARTNTGTLCSVDDPAAVCFCAMGALLRACSLAGENEAGNRGLWAVAEDVLDRVSGGYYVYINETRGHQAVLDLYDRAIALAEKEQRCRCR
jgi:hypothetical protein